MFYAQSTSAVISGRKKRDRNIIKESKKKTKNNKNDQRWNHNKREERQTGERGVIKEAD